MMFYTFMGIAELEGSQKLGKGFVSREKLFLKIKKTIWRAQPKMSQRNDKNFKLKRWFFLRLK